MSAQGLLILVEDNLDDIFLFRRALTKANSAIQFDVFENGQVAKDYFMRWLVPGFPNLPQVIMLDLKMPLLDGLKVLEWLRSHPVFASVAIVMLTSSQNPSDLRDARRLGAQAYLTKHATSADILAVLAAAEQFSAGRTAFQVKGDLLANNV